MNIIQHPAMRGRCSECGVTATGTFTGNEGDALACEGCRQKFQIELATFDFIDAVKRLRQLNQTVPDPATIK